MRTIRTKVYQFSELSKAAKLKAIEWYKDGLDKDSGVLDGFEDYCKEAAKEEGFNDIKLQYSLSYSQGDGLSFSCNDFDLKRFLVENTRLRAAFVDTFASNLNYFITGNKGSHYAYASRSDIDMYITDNANRNGYPNIESIVDLLRVELEDKYLALCKRLEKAGYDWIEAQYEDDNVIENIEANEYEFKQDGTRF